MHRYITLCVLLVSFFTAHAQPVGVVAFEEAKFDEQFAKATVPQVTGKLLHISPEEIKKTTISYSLVTIFGQVKKIANPAPDGSFKLELEYPLPYQQVWLEIEDVFYAGLYANKDLYVELDFDKIKQSHKEVDFNGDGVRYLGADGPLNVYMNNYVLFRRKERLALGNRLNAIPRSRNPVAAEVLAAYGGIFDSLKMIEDDYTVAHPSPYAWLLANERMSEYYGQICISYWGHRMEDTLLEKIRQHKTYLTSNSGMFLIQYLSAYFFYHPDNFVKVIWKDVALLPDLSNTEKAAIDSLRAADTLFPAEPYPYTAENKLKWSKQLGSRMSKLMHDRSIRKDVYMIDSLFPPSQADLLKLNLNQSKDIDERKAAMEKILPSLHSNWCRLLAQTEYNQAVGKIAAINKALNSAGNATTATGFGKPILQTDFGASLYKPANMTAIDFLARLRQSFAGKAIVLDLWATWCSPCLSEMPHSKALQQSSKDLPVVFVYLCTISGSDETRWKRKIAELELPGIHFLIDETLDAELRKYFSFGGYPGYAFIDRTGVYQPGALTRVSQIKDREALAVIVK